MAFACIGILNFSWKSLLCLLKVTKRDWLWLVWLIKYHLWETCSSFIIIYGKLVAWVGVRNDAVVHFMISCVPLTGSTCIFSQF